MPITYDRQLATNLAPEVATHLRGMAEAGRKYDYNRRIVKAFQQASGIDDDGHYGGETRGALLYFAPSSRPPRPFFKPTQTIPYNPPEPEAIAPTPPPVPPPRPSAPSPPRPAPPPPVVAPPRPAPRPAPPPPVVAPPRPAPPPPPPTPPQADPIEIPSLQLSTIDTSIWTPEEYEKFEELSRNPGNSPWQMPAMPTERVNRVALGVVAGTVLTIWYGRKKGWF